MSNEIKITIKSPNINLEKTVENICKIAPDDSFSYIDSLSANNTVGSSIEELVKEENPDYVYNGIDNLFLEKLVEEIEDSGVYMMLGVDIDSDDFVYETGFGAKIYKNVDGEYEITFGVTAPFGHGFGAFDPFVDEGDAESIWDIASKECQEAIKIANKNIVL